ncbi:unnamed protein product [Schistocephalus solidus]|uniref:LAM_G_DOMAIN domain-containing protein n=1 Tax=Schistocephalus solidus TaxID=70667 RepID=A0A183SFG3_SCHSO|nr:unnamed protein product [Schistocephalus solidus]
MAHKRTRWADHALSRRPLFPPSSPPQSDHHLSRPQLTFLYILDLSILFQGTAVVKLTVFDADAPGDQGLLFLLKNSTSRGLFSLNPRSGELSFAREVVDEDIGSHHLEIEAS